MHNFNNILIADDHNLIQDGLAQKIAEVYPNCILYKANTKAQMLNVLADNNIDVLIQDILLGDDDARIFITDIKTQYPLLKIVIISTLTDKLSVSNLLRQGVNGYVSKTDDSDGILKALQYIRNNKMYLSPELKQIQNAISNQKSIFITQREEKILRLIVQAKTSKAIAEELNISIKTVETHRSNLFARFGVKNVVDLVKKALFEGYS